MDEPCDDFEKNRLIQEEFGVDLLTASRVIDTYYKDVYKRQRLFWLSWRNWMLFLRMMRANAGNKIGRASCRERV